jgi:hypothetical protein
MSKRGSPGALGSPLAWPHRTVLTANDFSRLAVTPRLSFHFIFRDFSVRFLVGLDSHGQCLQAPIGHCSIKQHRVPMH